MRTFVSNLFIFSLLVMTSTVSLCQYITIEGRQFKDENGNNFYPLACNYNIGWMTSNLSNSFFPRAPINYDGWGWECSSDPSCLQQIERNFTQIKLMGFNTIRLYGLGPYYMYVNGMGYIFRLDAFNYNSSNTEYFYFQKPYNTDSNIQHIFQSFDDLLYEAWTVGLKVILVPVLWPTSSEGSSYFAEDFQEYLETLSEYVMTDFRPESREALLAYDLMNEPLFSHLSGWPEQTLGHTKQDVCEKVAGWYDAIRNNDPYHLITLGGSNYSDVFEWDPSVLKLDFYSPHLYSNKYSYETEAPVEQMIRRVAGKIFWASKTCPMPFLIGETGFRSQDGTNGPDGPTSEQLLYAQRTLENNLDCYGSGYSWWDYQDDGSYFGLLRPGNCIPECATLEKNVVQAFKTFSSNDSLNPCEAPPNYFDPYNHEKYHTDETSDTNAIRGTVLDENNNPIENAVIRAYTYLGFINDDSIYDVHYTFTDTIGYFRIIPFDYVPPYSNIIADLAISASGYDRLERGGWNNSPPIIQDGVYHLKGISFKFADTVNIAVNCYETGIFQAWDKITAKGYLLTSATGEIKAREEVNLKQEFSAFPTSEVEIMTCPTFPICDNFANFIGNITPNILANNYSTQCNRIELQFKYSQLIPKIRLCPNPNTGIFEVQLPDSYIDNEDVEIVIYNVVGVRVFEGISRSRTFTLHLTSAPKGLYIINLEFDKYQESIKFTIN